MQKWDLILSIPIIATRVRQHMKIDNVCGQDKESWFTQVHKGRTECKNREQYIETHYLSHATSYVASHDENLHLYPLKP